MMQKYWTSQYSLGYDNELFPYFYRVNDTRLFTGTLLQVWIEIQKYIERIHPGVHLTKPPIYNYHNEISFDDDNHKGYSGILGAIANGTIMSSINGLPIYDTKMLDTFRISLPLFFQAIGYYQLDAGAASTNPTLEFFLVFPPLELSVIFASVLAIAIINAISMSHQFSDAKLRNIALFVVQLLFPVCITFILFIYGASFRGHFVVSSPSRPTSFIDLMYKLRSHEYEMVTDAGFTDDQFDVVHDHRIAVSYRDDVQDVMEMICSAPSYIGRMYDTEASAMYIMPNPCSLSTIKMKDVPLALRKEIGQFDSQPYFLVFSKNFSTSSAVTLVNAVLPLFSEDNMLNFWNSRFIRLNNLIAFNSLKRYDKTFAHYDNINLIQISPVFFLMLGLHGLATLIALLEVIVYELQILRRICHFNIFKCVLAPLHGVNKLK